MSKTMMVTADPNTWAVGVHPAHGVVVGLVTGWRITKDGSTPVIDGGRVPAGVEVKNIIKGDPTTVAKCAMLYELLQLAGRATTDEAWEFIDRTRQRVMADGA